MYKKIAVVDEDLPRVIDRVLAKLDWEVMDVRDWGLRGKSDKEVIGFAKRRKAVLFSGDWGFANILEFPPHRYYGIAILNFPNEVSTDFIARETEKSVGQLKPDDFRGSLVIIEPGKVRIRSVGK